MELHTIKITPEDIEQHIKSAIIDSAIGKALESAISKNLQGWQFDQAVTKVVEQEIPKIIREIMLEPDKKAMISHAVREALTEPLVMNIVNKTIEHLWNS